MNAYLSTGWFVGDCSNGSVGPEGSLYAVWLVANAARITDWTE